MIKTGHDETATSKKVSRMERELAISLTKVWNQIKNDISISTNSGIDFATIRSFYEKYVSDLIRASVTEIFIEGGKYAAKSAGLPFFITEVDLAQIRQLAMEFNSYFWTGLDRELVKKLSMAFDPKTLLTMKNIEPQLKGTFVGRLAVSLASRTLSEATVLKTQQVGQESISPQFMSAQFIPDDYDPLEFLSLYDPKSPLLGQLLAQQEQQRTAKSTTRLVWTTSKDERVCPICMPLQGKIYDANEENVPIPVVSTHIHCRCRLMILDTKNNIILG